MSKNKIILLVTVLVIFALVCLVIIFNNSNTASTPVTIETGSLEQNTVTGVTPVQTVSNTPVKVIKSPATASTPASSASVSPISTPKQYTLSEVGQHSIASNCWSTVNGKVYNLTSWISKHPGGSEAIISMCGKDASSAFNGQHGGQARPASELANFAIGTLK